MSASSIPSSGLVRMNPPVFYFAASFILLFGLTVIAIPEQAGAWLLAAQNWAANTVGWYYMLAMTLYLVFVVVTALSGYGKIKLGADHDEPEFSYLSWAGMLFAAGISITLFFFCVSEPLTHLVQPPQGEALNGDAARQAMQILFLHWGLHGWGVFAFVGMALAYFAYRHNLPLALRSALYPLIGKRINGPIGYAVDGFGIIATVFGLGADMGFGVLHLNSGLDYLFGVAHTQWIQVGLITLMMGAAILVAVSGVDKGVRVMSDINMLLACALLLFVLFAGPTQHLLNTLIRPRETMIFVLGVRMPWATGSQKRILPGLGGTWVTECGGRGRGKRSPEWTTLSVLRAVRRAVVSRSWDEAAVVGLPWPEVGCSRKKVPSPSSSLLASSPSRLTKTVSSSMVATSSIRISMPFLLWLASLEGATFCRFVAKDWRDHDETENCTVPRARARDFVTGTIDQLVDSGEWAGVQGAMATWAVSGVLGSSSSWGSVRRCRGLVEYVARAR